MKVCYKPYLMVVIAMMTANTNNAQGPKWVAAEHLDVGFKILLADGSTASIKKMDKEVLDVPVFNFSVDGLSTYYVGQTGSLVHNNKKCPWWKTDPDFALVRYGRKPLSQADIDAMPSVHDPYRGTSKADAQEYRNRYIGAKNRLLAKRETYLKEAWEAQDKLLEEGKDMVRVLGKNLMLKYDLPEPFKNVHPIKMYQVGEIHLHTIFLKGLK